MINLLLATARMGRTNGSANQRKEAEYWVRTFEESARQKTRPSLPEPRHRGSDALPRNSRAEVPRRRAAPRA